MAIICLKCCWLLPISSLLMTFAPFHCSFYMGCYGNYPAGGCLDNTGPFNRLLGTILDTPRTWKSLLYGVALSWEKKGFFSSVNTLLLDNYCYSCLMYICSGATEQSSFAVHKFPSDWNQFEKGGVECPDLDISKSTSRLGWQVTVARLGTCVSGQKVTWEPFNLYICTLTRARKLWQSIFFSCWQWFQIWRMN